MRAAAVAILMIACAHPRAEVPNAPPGRSVAIYMPPDAPPAEVAAALETMAAQTDKTATPAPSAAGATALGYVDDRRWIDLAPGDELTLPDLPATADLDSLVVEPLGEAAGPDALAIVQCTRQPTLAGALADLGHARGLIGRAVTIRLADGDSVEGTVRSLDEAGVWLDAGGRAVRVDAAKAVSLRVAGASSQVRCRTHGAPGRHLIRIAYATTGVAWHAVHHVEVAIDDKGVGTATIRTGFQIDAPGWSGDADVALWRGLPGQPGEDVAPERVWAGRAGLGTQVTVWSEPKQLPAHTAAIYRGAIVSPSDSPTDPYWRQQSQSEVRTWLVIDGQLPPGSAIAAVVIGGAPARVVQAELTREGTSARMPLWTDPELRGLRTKTYQSGDEHGLREHLAFSVANLSAGPRQVWIEEELRPARRHQVQHARPKIDVADGWLKVELTVPAGGLGRATCDVVYDL